MEREKRMGRFRRQQEGALAVPGTEGGTTEPQREWGDPGQMIQGFVGQEKKTVGEIKQ